MSTPGRGRGYTGRHHLREPRPGDAELSEELEAARTLAELSPRSTDLREHKEKRNMERPDVSEVRARAPTDDILTELLTIDEQFTPLLTLLEQFSPGEDGIQFNRKLRQFETTVANLCPDENRLHQAFSTFRAAALLNSVTARKLAAVGASFTRQQRQQLLRGALLNVVMQGTYSKLDVLERANPIYLINAANLMGDYFAEARLCNGNKVHILAVPLLQYLRALLASDDLRAHRSLATQLMQNGREILSVHAQELDELSISIRLRLLTPPPISIIWLLLSADLCLNKFMPLPNTLQQFYAAHLELNTDDNYSEVSYGSWKKSPEKDDYKSDGSLDLSAEKIGHNLSQVNLNHSDDSKPKLRPILGAGAGLLRQEQALSVNQDTFDTWTTKNSLTKRYDLNSWRQNEDEKEECEPVFNPAVLPPNFSTAPNYPPPNQYTYTEEYPNYLQQGDGTYIQNQYNNINYNQTQNYSYQECQGNDVTQQTHLQDLGNDENSQTTNVQLSNEQTQISHAPERTSTDRNQGNVQDRPMTDRGQANMPETGNERSVAPQVDRNQMTERVNNETQKTSSRKPVENWRKEKSDLKDDPNRNRQRNWNRPRSKDNVNDDDDDKYKDRSASRTSRDSKTRLGRRNSGDSVDTNASTKSAPRRHVADVPRNNKYWDHDDRCDKDYNS